jgi:multisubunit Na+/H+ antiporter MnhE subunit
MPAVRAWLVWWVLLTAFYVVLVDTRRAQELVAAVVVGALGATASLIVRRERDDVVRLRWRTALRELRAILAWPRDLWLLTGALVRRPGGRVVEVPFEGDASDAALAVAERSLAPNTVVIDIDEERGVLIYHELMEPSPSTRPEGTERSRRETPWA